MAIRSLLRPTIDAIQGDVKTMRAISDQRFPFKSGDILGAFQSLDTAAPSDFPTLLSQSGNQGMIGARRPDHVPNGIDT